MSIVLDVSAGVNVKAGLGRYSRELTRALVQELDTPPSVFYNHIEGRTKVFPAIENLEQHTLRAGYKPWRMAAWMGSLLPIGFNRLVPNATLFHAHEHLLMPLRGVPTVMTVHDLIYKIFPEHHKRLNYIFLNQAMPRFVKRADAIITISEASKRDLIKYYGTPSEKIHVIYEAADAQFKRPSDQEIQAVRETYNLPEQYLLVVGTIEPRKNYSRLVEALMRLRETHSDLKLLVVGSKGWLFDEFFQKIDALNANDHVIFPGYVPDEDLAAIYADCTLHVMPSVYEGFGLPVLEAMQCGAVVASSNASSLPELGGDVARYFDPASVDEMVAVIDGLLSDSALRESLSVQGVEQASQFTWQRTAQETIDVYNQLL